MLWHVLVLLLASAGVTLARPQDIRDTANAQEISESPENAAQSKADMSGVVEQLSRDPDGASRPDNQPRPADPPGPADTPGLAKLTSLSTYKATYVTEAELVNEDQTTTSTSTSEDQITLIQKVETTTEASWSSTNVSDMSSEYLPHTKKPDSLPKTETTTFLEKTTVASVPKFTQTPKKNVQDAEVMSGPSADGQNDERAAGQTTNKPEVVSKSTGDEVTTFVKTKEQITTTETNELETATTTTVNTRLNANNRIVFQNSKEESNADLTNGSGETIESSKQSLATEANTEEQLTIKKENIVVGENLEGPGQSAETEEVAAKHPVIKRGNMQKEQQRTENTNKLTNSSALHSSKLISPAQSSDFTTEPTLSSNKVDLNDVFRMGVNTTLHGWNTSAAYSTAETAPSDQENNRIVKYKLGRHEISTHVTNWKITGTNNLTLLMMSSNLDEMSMNVALVFPRITLRGNFDATGSISHLRIERLSYMANSVPSYGNGSVECHVTGTKAFCHADLMHSVNDRKLSIKLLNCSVSVGEPDITLTNVNIPRILKELSFTKRFSTSVSQMLYRELERMLQPTLVDSLYTVITNVLDKVTLDPEGAADYKKLAGSSDIWTHKSRTQKSQKLSAPIFP